MSGASQAPRTVTVNHTPGAAGWHAAEHLVLMTAAVSPSRLLPPLPYEGQLRYLFVFGMPMTVGAGSATPDRPLLS